MEEQQIEAMERYMNQLDKFLCFRESIGTQENMQMWWTFYPSKLQN